MCFVAYHLLFCNHLASYDNLCILKCEKKVYNRTERELLIIWDQPTLNRNIILVSLCLFDNFDSFYIVLIKCTFYYFVICKCMSTTFCDNGTFQFFFVFVWSWDLTILLSRVAMRLIINIVTRWDSIMAILFYLKRYMKSVIILSFSVI